MRNVFLLALVFCQLAVFSQTPGITINSITPARSHYCVGDTVVINFTTVNFTGTNTFTARMSKSGFALDSTAMSSTSVTGNSVATLTYVFLNANADVDSGYQVRVRSGSTVSALYPVTPFVVNPKPAAVASVSSQTICSGSAFNTVTFTTSNNVANTTYAWSRNNTTNVSGAVNGTGSIPGSVLVNNTLTNQTVTYSVTPTGPSPSNCEGSAITTTVVVKPTPIYLGVISDTVCSGARVNITLSASVASSYSWVAADNMNTEGEEILPRAGNPLRDTIVNLTTQEQLVFYTVTPTSSAGACEGNPQVIAVTVNPKPVTISDTAVAVCSGTPLAIPLASDIASSFAWRALSVSGVTGESTTTQNTDTIQNTLVNTTALVQTVTYLLTATSVEGGCVSNVDTIRVTVYPKPAANFSIANPASQCERGNSFQFTATQNAAVTNYNWTFGSPLLPSTDNGAVVTETFTGTGDSIPVTLITETANNCPDTFQRIINVYPMPVADFTVSDTSPCSGDTVRFQQTNVTHTNSLTWLWGDGTANSTCTGCDTGKHKYTSTVFPSVRTVRLIAVTDKGCRDTALATINVKPTPDANFTIDDNVQCLDNGNNLFVFTDNSTIADSTATITYTWNFGDNSAIELTEDAAHTYSAADTYFVFHSVVSDFGCSDSIGKMVVVYLHPGLQITNNAGQDTLCGGIPVTLSATSGFAYQWSTGATTQSIALTDSSASVPYTIFYSVTVTDNRGCTASSSKPITVIPSVAAPEILFDSTLSYCAGARAHLFHISNPGSSVFTWNLVPDVLGLNGFTGPQLNLDLPDFPGDTFTVFVLATDTLWGCEKSDTITFVISENTAPTGTIVRDGFTLICTNNTAVSYQWGYDDAALQEVTLSGETLQSYFAGSDPDFAVSGKYYWVKITDANGCTSKIYYQSPPQYFTAIGSVNAATKTIRIYPNPAEEFLKIETEAGDNYETVEICNATGQLLYREVYRNEMRIDISNWSSGLYLVKVVSKTGAVKMQRLLKM